MTAGTTLFQPRAVAAHAPFGPIATQPEPPEMSLHWHDAARRPLRPALRGQLTIVQTMFTGCSAVCPIQGALFAELQDRLKDLPADDPLGRQVRLLSISVDPLSDDPKALQTWLGRHGAARGWAAASPDPARLDALLDFLSGRADGADRHTTQLALFDSRGRFVYRTREMPTPESVIEIAGAIARDAHRRKPR